MPRERTLLSVRRRLLPAAGFSTAAWLALAYSGGCGGIGEGGTGAIPEAGVPDTSIHLSSSGGSTSSSGASSDDGSTFVTDDGPGDDALSGDGASDDATGDAEVDDASPDAMSSGDAADDGSDDGASSGGSSSGASSDSGVSGDGGLDATVANDASSDGATAPGDATLEAGDAGTERDATIAVDAGVDAASPDAGPDGSATHAPDAGADGGVCNLAADWGIKVTVDVSWPSTGLVNAGGTDNGDATEQVQIWALLTPVGSATGTSVPARILPCNIVLPDFGSIIGETYGATFPPSLFDHAPSYLTAVSTTLTLGATTAPTSFSLPGETNLIGMSAPATGAWPSSASAVTEVDMDADGEPGVTALSKTPPTYSYVPTTIIPSLPDFDLVRADKLYMAIRFVTTSLSGAMSSCSSASGSTNSVNVEYMDSHILGCHVFGGADGGAGDCNALQATFVDDNRPVFTVDSASFTAAVVSAPTCAAVTAALP